MNTSEIMSAMIFGDGGASKVEELSTDGGSTDAGKVLVVGDNGKIAASDLTVGEGEVAIDKTLSVNGAAADAKKTGDAIASLNGSLATEQIPYEVISGYSPDANGAIVANTSRKCTSYISVARNSNILITATSASTLNWWYDSEKNPLSKFTVQTGNEQPYKVPNNAAYVVLSQPKNNMVDFRLYSDVRYEITQVAAQINGCIVAENSAWED